MNEEEKISFQEFISLTGIEYQKELSKKEKESLKKKLWLVFQNVLGAKDEVTKYRTKLSIEDFVKTYYVAPHNSNKITFYDHLITLGVIDETFNILPGKKEIYEVYHKRWDSNIYQVVELSEIHKYLGFSFNYLAKMANFISKEGVVLKDRATAYERMWLVYMILFDTDDKNMPNYLPPAISAKEFIRRYGFSPTSGKHSFADYLVDIQILNSDYSIVDQDEYDLYLYSWKEYEDCCIYAAIDKRRIDTFLEKFEEKNANLNLSSSFFNEDDGKK